MLRSNYMETLLLAELVYLGTPYVEYIEVMSFKSFEACVLYTDLNSDSIAYQIWSEYQSMVDNGSQPMVLDRITLGCSTIDGTQGMLYNK